MEEKINDLNEEIKGKISKKNYFESLNTTPKIKEDE